MAKRLLFFIALISCLILPFFVSIRSVHAANTSNKKRYVDLLIADVAADRTTVKEGEPVKFKVTVKNAGNTRSAKSQLRFKVDGRPRPESTAIRALRKGAAVTTQEVVLDLGRVGSHVVSVVVVPDGGDERPDLRKNNSKDVKIKVVKKDFIDLAVSNISLNKKVLMPGENFEVSFTITNKGNVLVEDYIATVLVGNIPADIVAMTGKIKNGGQRSAKIVSRRLKAVDKTGRYRVAVKVEPFSYQRKLEYKEYQHDNTAVADMEVAEKVVDFYLEPIEVDKTTAAIDEEVFLKLQVGNGGNVDGIADIELKLDDAILMKVPGQLVKAGETISFDRKITVNVAPGEHFITLAATAADGFGKLEANKENNFLERVIKVTSGKKYTKVTDSGVDYFDVSVKKLSLSDVSPKAGQHVIVKTEVANLGMAKGDIQIEIRLDEKVLYSSKVWFRPKETRAFGYRFKAEGAGPHKVVVEVKPLTVEDRDLDNNVKQCDITV